MNNKIKIAVEKLNNHDVVAFPTETVYGLGARIDSEVALKKIFFTKKRPFFDPLIVHAGTLVQAKSCFKNWNIIAETLTKKFWPGPLTLVMEKSDIISDLITSGLSRVGVRIPEHALALQLINEVGIPLAAPSANRFGKTSPTSAAHVRQEFRDEVFVLDTLEACRIGIESTVLLITESNEISILRKGALTQTQIINALSGIEFHWIDVVDKKDSPGHMKHHYMPEIPFVITKNSSLTVKQLSEIVLKRLNELPDEIESIKIAKPTQLFSKIEFLKLANTPEQAAREIYSQLRQASERRPDLLCLILTKDYSLESELWESVFDRLYKAASLIID